MSKKVDCGACGRLVIALKAGGARVHKNRNGRRCSGDPALASTESLTNTEIYEVVQHARTDVLLAALFMRGEKILLEVSTEKLYEEARRRGAHFIDEMPSFGHWEALSNVQRGMAMDVLVEQGARYRLASAMDLGISMASANNMVAASLRVARMTLETVDALVGPRV